MLAQQLGEEQISAEVRVSSSGVVSVSAAPGMSSNTSAVPLSLLAGSTTEVVSLLTNSNSFFSNDPDLVFQQGMSQDPVSQRS